MKRSCFVCAVSSVLLSGCTLSFEPETRPTEYYVLNVGFADTDTSLPSRAGRWTLRLQRTSAESGIDSTKIIFARNETTRGHYQFARWAVPPPERFGSLLHERLERETLFRSVSTRASSADYILYSEMLDLYHDASVDPGHAVMRIRMELIDGTTNLHVASRVFERRVPLTSFDAKGAVAAFNSAAREIIEDIASWARTSLSGREDGENIVFHEFAHQLDTESGPADGVPELPRRSMYIAWARVLAKEYEALSAAVHRNRETLIDPYGAEHPAEFFAVVTESFFERPVRLKNAHPELYEQLMLFYRQDPASSPAFRH